MSKKVRKYLVVLLLFGQFMAGIIPPIAKADDPPAQNQDLIDKIKNENFSNPTPNPGSTPSNSPASPGYGAKMPDNNTVKFNVTKYLTAEGQQQSYLKNSTSPVASFIVQAINFLVLTIGSFCFLSIVIGGFMLVVSNGNENLVNKGKEIIQYAVIGLVIVLFAYILVAFVQSLFYELPGK